jgi:hypothetical protein
MTATVTSGGGIWAGPWAEGFPQPASARLVKVKAARDLKIWA